MLKAQSLLPDPKKNIRVVVRPWTPRKIPYRITTAQAEFILDTAYPNLKKVVYVGWTRRDVNGKKQLLYLASTADTLREARRVFKTGTDFGINLWKLNPET